MLKEGNSTEELWHRIKRHAGATFTQIRGGKFTYQVAGGGLALDRTYQVLGRRQVEEAFSLVPLETTVPLQHLRDPSYLYAILMDHRIREGDW